MKVTLDTNILISGTFWTGDSFKILDLIEKGKVSSVLSKDILEEYYKVANSKEIIDKIKNKRLIILKVIEKIIKISIIVYPKKKLDVIKDDPDDNKIIECAIEGNVNFIITQDKHLLNIKEYNNIRIVTPKDFLKIIK